VTLEMLARENGMEATAEVLREWVVNKDSDLRGRSGGGSGRKDKKACGTAALECPEGFG
jgi:hypothetical protein